MAFHSRIMPCLDCWHWQGFRIRCALLPDEPRLLELHWAHGRALIEYGQIDPWRMAVSTMTLLLDSACDPALPWHWRSMCLDSAFQPLQAMQHLASTSPQQRRLNELRNRLATLQLLPSLSPSELAEGNPYE